MNQKMMNRHFNNNNTNRVLKIENMYKVSNYIDSIKKCNPSKEREVSLMNHGFYTWFDSYEEAKQFCIVRMERKIADMEKQLATLKRRLPKLKNMTEKL